ncbi:DUF3108 domain-containing protein [Massilia sp. 9096]|uniref:DUF3108 domain-containing protein n=1 Tax=Massilia sp. 9096 TaxID=1500894 RepID=UPI00068B52B3|nr:DUF3108 domain-containing protein [Massilia sp. 9096]
MSHAFDRARRPGAFRSRRRQIVLGAVTVLLHLVVFDWFSGELGVPQHESVRAEQPMQAELISDTPQPAPATQPPPQPKLDLPPLPDFDPEPVAVAEPPPPKPQLAQPAPAAPGDANGAPGDAGAQVAGQSGEAGAGADSSGQAGAGAPAGAPAQASNGAAPAEPAASAKPASDAHPEVRHYKVDPPPSSEITMDVARVDANGTRWSGEESLAWQFGPAAAYRIQLEAGISVVFTRINLLTVTSEGTVGEDGFNPNLMTEKRRGRALTATHFNRADGTMTFSSSQAKYPLTAGAQDKASVTLQLVAIARADPKQLSGNIDIFVGEDRDASVFSFTVAGQEQIDTPMGRIATWHLVRPPKPGSYNSRLDLWLAPSYGWLPVQIRNLEASGAVTTQTARKIEKKEAGNS